MYPRKHAPNLAKQVWPWVWRCAQGSGLLIGVLLVGTGMVDWHAVGRRAGRWGVGGWHLRGRRGGGGGGLLVPIGLVRDPTVFQLHPSFKPNM